MEEIIVFLALAACVVYCMRKESSDGDVVPALMGRYAPAIMYQLNVLCCIRQQGKATPVVAHCPTPVLLTPVTPIPSVAQAR